MDPVNIRRITEVLIYKDRAYWITKKAPYKEDCYIIITLEDWTESLEGHPRDFANGFETPTDAFSYLASLKAKGERSEKEKV